MDSRSSFLRAPHRIKLGNGQTHSTIVLLAIMDHHACPEEGKKKNEPHFSLYLYFHSGPPIDKAHFDHIGNYFLLLTLALTRIQFKASFYIGGNIIIVFFINSYPLFVALWLYDYNTFCWPRSLCRSITKKKRERGEPIYIHLETVRWIPGRRLCWLLEDGGRI